MTAQVSWKPRHVMVLETNHTLPSFGLAGCLLNACLRVFPCLSPSKSISDSL